MTHTLVVGASGFIGRALCRALTDTGNAVRGTYRRAVPANAGGVEWQQIADLSSTPIPASLVKGCETVFHLAGDAHAWMEKNGADVHHQVTVEGTRHLLQTAIDTGVKRFVFFSSVKAGGDGAAPEKPGMDMPTDDYGRARREAETLVLAAGRRYGLHVCNLRLAMVYGAGMKGNLPRMIETIDRGRFPPWPRVPNRRSMVWVEDVVRAALLAVARPEANGKTYVVTDGEAYSTRRIYEAICRALGKPVPRWSVPMPVLRGIALFGDAIGAVRRKRFVFDSEALDKLAGSAWYSLRAIEEELGFTPTKRLEDILPEIVATLQLDEGHRKAVR